MTFRFQVYYTQRQSNLEKDTLFTCEATNIHGARMLLDWYKIQLCQSEAQRITGARRVGN